MSRLSLDKAPEQKRQPDTASSMEREHAPKPLNLAQDLLALQRTAGNQAVTQLLQRAQHHSSSGSPMSQAPSIVHKVLCSPGQPLAAVTRAFMEARFGYDFSQVRIHTDAQAADSARAVNAQAYTVGSNVVFGAGQYAPEAREGKRLIAHELSHVVQQQSTPTVLQGKLSIGSPSDSAELAADAAARAVMLAKNVPYRSSALHIRDHLRHTSLPSATIQRAVETWGGEFDTDTYELTKKRDKNGVKMDGVKMQLRFVPNKHVDAELIAMVQTSRSLHQGEPIPAGAFSKNEAKQRVFERFRLPLGEAKAGTLIDQRLSQPNPLYAAVAPSYTLANTVWHSGFGRPGWRFIRNNVLEKHDPLLKDEPRLPSVFASGSPIRETSQVFETTALAVKGVQEGTFYGSVEWGWEKDADGNVTKLPLKLVSKDVPSRVFSRASARWNISKTSKGKETIPLPVAFGQYTNTRGVLLISDPMQKQFIVIGDLEKDTRLEVIDIGYAKPFNINKPSDKYKWWKVTVVDGIHQGKVGWVRRAYLSNTMSR